MPRHKKKQHFSFLSYVFIAFLVTAITVGVILVQEGTGLFSFAASPWGM